MNLTTAYLCLGSNIDPHQNIRRSVERIITDFPNAIVSSAFLSSAIGFQGNDFLNLAVALSTTLSLAELLEYTNQLEQAAGRVRVRRGNFDSRTLDVDVVMYGDLVGEQQGRMWPSQDITDNAHVLRPLTEIAGNVVHPGMGLSFDSLWDAFDQASQPLKRIGLVSICLNDD